MHRKRPSRACRESQDLTSESWAEGVPECGGREGLVAGDSEASTLTGLGGVVGRDELVRAAPIGTFRGHEGNRLEESPSRRRQQG
jgi:hypothetical protein